MKEVKDMYWRNVGILVLVLASIIGLSAFAVLRSGSTKHEINTVAAMVTKNYTRISADTVSYIVDTDHGTFQTYDHTYVQDLQPGHRYVFSLEGEYHTTMFSQYFPIIVRVVPQ